RTCMKRVGLVVGGALLGVLLAALWWMRLDRRTCEGGCELPIPPGDLTLGLGAAAGAAAALLVMSLYALWQRGTDNRA
ncbi:MAG: hypothetical protein LH469_08725, partial [Frankiaceae bacterium]|nr:hypothetical protein [Frankiaceae bacterium]